MFKSKILFILGAVFLGFAYHEQSLELLTPEGSSQAKRVYGIGFGISESNIEIIKKDIAKLLNQKKDKAVIELNINKQCNKLFDDYSRRLSQEFSDSAKLKLTDNFLGRKQATHFFQRLSDHIVAFIEKYLKKF